MCIPLFAGIGAALGASASSAAAIGTATVISAVATAASTAMSIESGIAQKDAANANADAQRKTAISAENQGAQQSYDQLQKARKIAATGAAAAGAGGVDPTTGTPLTLDTQTIGFGELDSLRIVNNAQRTAWGYQAQAGIDETQGKNAMTGGMLNAGATLLGGASSAYFDGMRAAQGTT